MKSTILTVSIAASFLLTIVPLTFAMDQQRAKSIPLIPRKILFGNPEKIQPSISPDGTMIAYLAPLNKKDESSVLNIWIKTVGSEDDRLLTHESNRPIRGHVWSPDGLQLLFLKDANGDENWRVYGVNISTNETVCYTPFDQVQARVISHNSHDTSLVLLGLNKDNPEVHDVYSLDLKSKKLTLLYKNNEKIAQWATDNNIQLRAGLRYTDEGGLQLLIRKNNQTPWKIIQTYPLKESLNNSCTLVGFSDKHNVVYMIDSLDNKTARLVSYDADTYQKIIIAQDAQFDIADVRMNPNTEEIVVDAYFNPKTETIEAIRCNKIRPEWQIVKDGVCKQVLTAFKSYGNVTIIGHDSLARRWIVQTESDTNPLAYYLYDTTACQITELFKTRPLVPPECLIPSKPISFKSRDGLTVHGYLTLFDRNPMPGPLVLLVHGGPWMRDSLEYNSQVQWLANRGYSVLQINYRGSIGYGKDFTLAGFREWGGKIHNDLIDGVNWAIQTNIADPKKIAIFGGSFGGYSALVGATFTPDVFCCAVDYVGMSNLITFMQSLPAYWKPFRQRFIEAVGDPETEQDFLKSRSPLFKIDALKIPLLIAQGAHDPRVKKAESEQIIAALKERNIPYKYLCFSDEGHGFVKAENRLRFFAAAEVFLALHMGGRCE